NRWFMAKTPYLRATFFASIILAISGGLTACQSVNGTSSNQPVILKGAGATFPAPLYQRWISEFTERQDKSKVTISYDSVGSGKGVERFLSQSVDFGATDAPLKNSDRQKLPSTRGEAIQIPTTGGMVVFAYNLSDALETEVLKLSRTSYCGIVTGKIKNWNDPKIAADNPNTQLPDLPILFVSRQDGSGTTYIFTNHLKAACPNWKAGASKSVTWPVGISAKGNEGVSAEIRQSNGAIGYIEYSYAKNNQLSVATLENKSGQFIEPKPENASSAFEGQSPSSDFALTIPDPQSPGAYPIVGLTWLLLYSQYTDTNQAVVLKDFIRWSLTDGEQYAKEMGYFPLTPDLREQVLKTLDNL
ncbi:MAG: phosphate ABC transporter substrate-binding protein PstS, partial [Microcystaceae cyanobacterium]